ncbi:MAG: 4Fe-4S binding protein [Bacteroidales bacterium]|nr:4Fe-4S binding protein [Bacteroidales bacterium]
MTEEQPKVTEEQPQKKGRIKFSTIRGLVCLAVFVVLIIGLIFSTGTGTLSSMGISFISTICPLGALESMLGGWILIPRAIIILLAIVLIIVLVGKAFCSWLCPIPHVQNLFKGKKRKQLEADQRQEAAKFSLKNWREGKKPQHRKVNVDSRYAVLAAALLSTAIFGFPVFCLVCPVGLSFATIITWWRFIQFNELTWGLIIFPAIIVLEVVVLRKWCGRICPLGALLSLVSSLNKTFRPSVKTDTCLRDTKNADCDVCASACPEHIDPVNDLGERPMTECIKCHNCADSCPVCAITFPFIKKKLKGLKKGDGGEELQNTQDAQSAAAAR